MKAFFKKGLKELKECMQRKNYTHSFVKFSLGRSMIEMLGVLAIIGVLSIGGFYAYRQAIQRYQANITIDFINRIRLGFKESCTFADKCKWASGGDESRQFLCETVG